MNPNLQIRFAAQLLCWVVVFFLGNVYLTGEARASTFTVTRFDDPPPTLGCNVGNCSLRQAIIAARDSPNSTVMLPAGTYTLSIPGLDTVVTNEAVGDLDIRVATSIIGAGVGSTIVQVGSLPFTGTDRIFDNHSPDSVLISKMTIRNGYDAEGASGGCIRNAGVLTLDKVLVTGCESPIGGGGIASYHTLTFRNSTITGNRANSPIGQMTRAGAILGGPGSVLGTNSTVNIIDSVISNNIVSSTGNVDLTAFGGGVANNATMNIRTSTITANTALNVGGIINGKTGMMTITNSTISDNKARFDVGGVDNENKMAVINSTFSGNMAGFDCVGSECDRGFAGGVINANNGIMTVDNSTFSNNTCVVGGGGILNATGMVTVSSSTIVENTGGLGAGIAGSHPIFIKNSIVANNTASPLGGNLSGYIISQGFNLFQDTNGSYLSGDLTGNIVGEDPLIGLLQKNSGPTATHALSVDSPALNHGNPTGCLSHAGLTLLTDQRGHARSQQGRCDIGAVEMEDGKSTLLSPIFNLLLP